MKVKPTEFWKLDENGEPISMHVEPDSAEILVRSLQNIPVDLMYTSGHATEHDWQIAFNMPGGEIRSEKGQLYARNSHGERFAENGHPFRSYLDS